MRIAGIVAACALIALAADGTAKEPDALAGRILEAVGRPVGLVHLPRCGDGSLAVALAGANEHLYVHGQDADAANVAAAREAADRHGLLNRRVSIDQGSQERLLPVGKSCDLVVITDLARRDLTPELAAEIRRVLHPWYGVAVLGDASGRLDGTGLTDWAKRIAPEVSSLPGHGTLVTVKAEPLNGADNWTHWWHGPDNNAVSSDTAYRVPETVQWTGKPYFSTRLELPIVMGGRLFMLWNGHLLDTTRGEPILPGEEVVLDNPTYSWTPDVPVEELRGPLLTARAVGSGVRLWERRLSGAAWLQAARSTIVADGDCLLVADGSSILELDQATGQQRRRVDTDCGEIRWMAVADGCVLLVGGPRFSNVGGRRSEKNVIPFRSSGLELTVLDRRTLKKRWQESREEGPDAFDPRSPAAAGGRLFICTEGGDAEAYRIKDGTLQWRTDTGIVRLAPRSFEWDRSSRHPVTGYAVAGLYVISGPETDRCPVLSQEDGESVWELPRGRGPVGPIPLAFGGLLWMNGHGLDPATGTTGRQVSLDRGGCSRFTAAPQGILGTCGLAWDLATSEATRVLPAKSACGAGQYVAGGLAWKFPSACTACTQWRGFMARAPAEKPPPVDGRLVADAGASEPGAALSGWTTYRGDAERSASTPACVGRHADLCWRLSPLRPPGPAPQDRGLLLASEIVPVPPVIGGDVVVVGSGDGTVEAIDLKAGKRLWRARTGGRIYSSPTIWKDRVLVGSADGHLYAFRLRDGRELWRLRVAPQAGRMMLYGQLGSRWPVLGSPLVVEGRVYAVAGLLGMLDGVCAVAADAASGRILWERTDWEDTEVEDLISGRCLAGTGQLCWDDEQGEVVFGGGDAPPVRLSPADGACRVAYARGRVEELSTGWPRNWQTLKRFRDTYSSARGQDVGCLGPGWTVFGGRRLLIDQSESGTWRMNLHFLAQDENGDGRFPLLQAADCVLTPSWDEADVLFMLQERRSATVALVSRSKLFAALEGRSTAAAEGLEWMLREIKLNTNELASWRTELPYQVYPEGCVLTSDAALLLATHRGSGRLTAWNRADGKQLWQMDLLSVPVRGGLAVATDGRVVVTLRDGGVLCIATREQSAR